MAGRGRGTFGGVRRTCSDCGQPFNMRDVRAELGPGASARQVSLARHR